RGVSRARRRLVLVFVRRRPESERTLGNLGRESPRSWDFHPRGDRPRAAGLARALAACAPPLETLGPPILVSECEKERVGEVHCAGWGAVPSRKTLDQPVHYPRPATAPGNVPERGDSLVACPL